MQKSLSFALKNSTNQQVSLLLNRDFKAFNRIKTQHPIFHSITNLWHFFAKFFQKKPIFYALLFCTAFFAVSVDAALASEDKTFVATAYYSPLPDQKKYYTGSYEGDIRLNGEGIRASDGTPVYIGMIAAPKTYAFGSKIDLHGIGVVSVHDRGGAIGSGEWYDRIDIWMGTGDEGLERTLEWGRRELTGRMVSSDTPTSLRLDNITTKAASVTDIVTERLKKLWYNTNKNFKEYVTDFQIDYNIIPSRNDEAAGSYGPKTRAKLSEVYANFLKNQNPTAKVTTLENIVSYADGTPSNAAINAEKRAENMSTNFMGVFDIKVQNLQHFLNHRGFGTDSTSGTMDLSTLHALRKYQYSKNIGQTGRVDLRTQVTIARDLSQ